MLATLRYAVRALFSSNSRGEGTKTPTTSAASAAYFDTYNSTAAKLQVSVTRVGPKFVVSLICRQCDGKITYVHNAADDNLAIAVGFVLDSYGLHAKRMHK